MTIFSILSKKIKIGLRQVKTLTNHRSSEWNLWYRAAIFLL